MSCTVEKTLLLYYFQLYTKYIELLKRMLQFFISPKLCRLFTIQLYHTLYNSLMELFEPPHDKTNKVAMRPTKTQISLGIRPVRSESSLCVQWIAKDPTFLHVDSEDTDQTGRMPRLIWVFAGRTATLLVLSWGGSFLLVLRKVQECDECDSVFAEPFRPWIRLVQNFLVTVKLWNNENRW